MIDLEKKNMLCRRNSCVDVAGSVPVFLNVYDITPVNDYTYWLGLGAYHSGIEVHEVEYAYGAHEYSSTGIFEGEPKQCEGEGFRFRKAILIGWTELGPQEVRKVMEELAVEYKGNAYNLITKNCNHFSNDACIRLTNNPIPSWVNRLARIGLLCNCVIPAKITMAKIRHHKKEEKGTKEDKKVGSRSNKNRSKKLSKSSNSSTSSSSSSSDVGSTTATASKSSRRRPTDTLSSPLIQASPRTSTSSS